MGLAMSFQTRVVSILVIGLMVMGLGYERVVNASMSDIDPKTMDARAVAEAVEAAARSGATGRVAEDSFLKPDRGDALGADELLEVPAPPGYFDELDASLANNNRRPALRNAEIRDLAEGLDPDSALAIILDRNELPYYAGSQSATTVSTGELETEPLMLGEQTSVGGPAGGPEQDLRLASLESVEAAVNNSSEAVDGSKAFNASEAKVKLDVADPDPEVEAVPLPNEKSDSVIIQEIPADRDAQSTADRIAAFEEQLSFSFERFEGREIERRADPRFPSKCENEADEAEIVTVRFRVRSNGRAYRPRIAATTNECLNNAALSAARKARFNVKRLRRRTDRNDDFILSYAFDNRSG